MNKENARWQAVQILLRVYQGSYTNLVLKNTLRQTADSRDRQLITLLVNGVLKNRETLDFALRQHLRKPISALPAPVREILRVTAYQILYLDRIPAAVAINEGVELAKRQDFKFTGLVNSVLRRVMLQGWNLPWPDKEKQPVRYLSVRYSHPEWMVRRWWKRWGFSQTAELCRLNNEPSPTWIRTNTLKISREELVENLQGEGVKVELGARVPESLLIQDFGALERLESYQAGNFTAQDESSQLVAHILQPGSGQTVLDACSAPGGKATHIAQLMGNRGQILAYDIYPHKLELVRKLAERLGIKIIQPVLGDARELPGVKTRSMHRVLVDAPCSGLGIIRRKADLRWQKQETDIQVLAKLQLQILEQAARCVVVGGELVYSTCTIEPEENFEVAKTFRLNHPEFEVLDITGTIPFMPLEEQDLKPARKGMLQLLTQRHGTDGFFLAKFRRREV
ncbi:MAG: 16S rRNA (cytosine(967)-C(5))-methyltransferase RsmB [Desulfitobacteriaceae bacterium]|nr:16S rRNA (cytosine(967)-C(5))-methyltransferase RsmB [Desulfitobacteriaceae bacterium]MDD4345652.1 16S rRNA (cytosine(967)-C(5))-methyltransferase RsmB [Desulfitobacteriaceae bacterium]MDD4400536.1 16S rRNA (cytosine(967)-C(5))-methyltransferase RsmB [Desulfitobacteriaceae bacterium]